MVQAYLTFKLIVGLLVCAALGVEGVRRAWVLKFTDSPSGE